MRLMPIHPVMKRATVMDRRPGLRIRSRSVTVTRYGMLLMTSTIRCMTISTFPPKYPEIRP